MTTPHRLHSAAPTARRRRLLAWAAIALAVLLAGGFFGGRAWLLSYLRSERFRVFVSRAAGESLQAQAEFAPLRFDGMQFYSDGFRARGTEASAFSELRIEQIRAEVSTRRILERVWQIEHVEVQRVEARLDGPRVMLGTKREPSPGRRTAAPGAGWLPNRVEIGSATIREANLHWEGGGGGRLTGAAVTIKPEDHGWRIESGSGSFEQTGYPSLQIDQLQLRYREPSLYITSAQLRQGETGRIAVTGEVEFENALDLDVELQGIDVAQMLGEDWRLRVHGLLAGNVKVRSALPARQPPVLSGTLRLEQGHLEALPVLDQIALFTRMQEFRRVPLSTASAAFERNGDRLQVRDLIAESKGLMRVEGSFRIEHDLIDGEFQVGVTAATLQWLPGSQDRVFTVSRGGYLWTPMRLTGPVKEPREDLSPRLIAAAKGAVIQGVENTVRDTIQSGKDAAKGAVDLLLPLFQRK